MIGGPEDPRLAAGPIEAEAPRPATGPIEADARRPAAGPIAGEDPRTAAVRIEALVAELGTTGDARITAAVEDLVRQMMQLYGAGLERMLELAVEQDEAAASAWFDRLADDPLVASLLALHDLHPHGVERRIAQAIARVHPIVDAAGGQLTLLGVDPQTIRVRLDAAPGVATPAANLRPLIERVLAEAAPEIPRIEFATGAAPVQFIRISR